MRKQRVLSELLFQEKEIFGFLSLIFQTFRQKPAYSKAHNPLDSSLEAVNNDNILLF
jgi:hypothetical protein